MSYGLNVFQDFNKRSWDQILNHQASALSQNYEETE